MSTKATNVIWIVDHGIQWEGGGSIASFSSLQEAHDFVEDEITEELESWGEYREQFLWEKIEPDYDDDPIEFSNGDSYYIIHKLELRGKTEYEKRLERALLYNFPGGDIESILNAIEGEVGS